MMKTIFALLILAAVAGTAVAAPPQNTGPLKLAAAEEINKGVVLSVIDTETYTYLEVSTGKGSMWLATMKMNVAKGDTVTYPSGLVMSNFHSKTLNRTFESILFVDRVLPVKK